MPPINIAMLFEQSGRVEQAIDWYRIAFRNLRPDGGVHGCPGPVAGDPLAPPISSKLLRDMRLDHWVRVYSETET